MSTVTTLTKMVLRCPYCGEISYYDISIFAFSRSRSLKFKCECGTTIALLGTKDRKKFWLQLECSYCLGRHVFYYNRKHLWETEILPLICDETGLDIAYIGEKNLIKQAVESGDKSLVEIAENLGFGDYFVNPEVMYGVLDYLNILAEEGKLFCRCGNYNIEIEIFPDRLDLKCGCCSCSGVIMAQDEWDLEKVCSLSEIQLTDMGFKSREGKKTKPRSRFKK
ncbi:MAG: hypothetical protein GX088_07850 [Clostridia bacterium]|nr:hypothetical protein [Clostridia bacterium]